MDISNILSQTEHPKLYQRGSATMWTEEYISHQLLAIHLNSELDLGTRKMSTVEKTSAWILEKTGTKRMNVLDLGCGPGLYAEFFASNSHQVTGIDISKVSIDYAKKMARQKKLDIEYIHANYLEIELQEDTYDLVVLIYTDFGVLLPDERQKLLSMIYKVLKKGGVFIFDVLNDRDLAKKVGSKNWEICRTGFWKETPYIALSDSYLYEREKVILFQHTIIDEKENVDVYRFWTHFFSDSDIEKELIVHRFSDISFYTDVLPIGDMWNGDNVTFCRAVKK